MSSAICQPRTARGRGGPTPAGDGGTRLVTRIHACYDWQHPLMALLGVLLMEFGDFAMLRRMLRGIKARAVVKGFVRLADGGRQPNSHPAYSRYQHECHLRFMHGARMVG